MRRFQKSLCAFFTLVFVTHLFAPTAAFALTGGPSQPEVQSFEPAATTEMVDLFSGDFVYNIPLLDVEGYPVNLAYHSGVTMDQEASWCGLGWNINPGVINRNMRGLPDDFNGAEKVTKDMYIKENYTVGATFGMSTELFGLDLLKVAVRGSLGLSTGVFYNNYKGVGFEQSIAPSISAGDKLKGSATLAISSNSQSGMNISPSASMTLSQKFAKGEGLFQTGYSYSVGAAYNSRSGIKALTFSSGVFVQKVAHQNGQKPDRSPMYGDQKGHRSVQAAATAVSYANSSYIPQIGMPMSNKNITFNGTLGGELFGLNMSGSLTGYFAHQEIAQRKVSKDAVGYLYSADQGGAVDVLHDINREKDGSYSSSNTNLPVTSFTYDQFMVSGQGIGGMFRAHRSDMGHVCDDRVESSGRGGSGGFEIGIANLLKWGVSVTANWSGSESHRWNELEGNPLGSSLGFYPKEVIPAGKARHLYEPVYFKSVGEKTAVNGAFLPFKALNEPVRPTFVTSGTDRELTADLRKDVITIGAGNERHSDQSNRKELPLNASTELYRKTRDLRTQSIQYLTAKQATFCLEPQLKSYTITTGIPDLQDYTPIPRTSDERKNNHITEISCLNTDGVRYVYGIAAYNRSQEEVSFTTKYVNETEGRDGMTSYSNVNNENYYQQKKGEEATGYDGYYNATKLPAYAHSYLLTGIVSPDYVDKGTQGPSPEDLGSYTKVNYTRVSDTYNWRSPYAENSAMLYEGMKSDHFDNKATFLYGQKEVWYVHSVESKNYVAVFKIESRDDGIGAENEHGGKATSGSGKSYRLKEIALYSRAELEANPSDPTPIKTVHFEYAYTLCKGIENSTPTNGNSNGKLTLKSVYFTYGRSTKGVLSKYLFNYNEIDPTLNPDYHAKAYDRWGNYKPVPSSQADPSNGEFPYVDQSAATDQRAQAWSLSEIELPSGSKVKVSYEADDYAFVQNRKAMQMFKISGLSNDASAGSSALYSGKSGNNYVHVSIPQSQACADVETFNKKFLPAPDASGVRYLYFNFLTYVQGSSGDKKEYVRGYAEIDMQSPVIRLSDTEYAIKVKDVYSEDSESSSYTLHASPFAKAAWQFLRINLPQYVYPGSDMVKTGASAEGILRSMFGIFYEMSDYMEGINDRLLKNDFAKYLDPSKSWVRLTCPTLNKKGGGCRVKRIELEDGWNNMLAEQPVSPLQDVAYGQEYDYTMVLDGEKVSSGVAAYEPLIGGDENPFRMPIIQKKENALIPDETVYSEEPMGESFFPGASVGYSKVTVRNLSFSDVKKHATGATVYEFYTSRDFPTLTRRTNTQTYKQTPNWITGLFAFYNTTEVIATQGYHVEVNDMHGKQRSVKYYAENLTSSTELGPLVSGVEYVYAADPDEPWRLNNTVKSVNGAGQISQNTTIGVDAEMVLDSRQHQSSTSSFGIELNNDFFLVLAAGVNVPIPFPSYTSEKTTFKSAVITKLVHRYGILQKTIAYQDNSTLTTENVIYDGKTGDVLLTKMQNEFEDPVYQSVSPAHWAYPGMDLASTNAGSEVPVKITSDGVVVTTGDLKEIFADGDEVSVSPAPENWLPETRWWVQLNHFYQGTSSDYYISLVDGVGNVVIGTGSDYTLKILRSGHRNIASMPISQVKSKSSSIESNLTVLSASNGILDAINTVYSESWKPYCKIAAYTGDQSVVCEPNFEAADAILSAVNGLALGQQIVLPSSSAMNSTAKTTEYVNSIIGSNRSTHAYTIQTGPGNSFDILFPMPNCSTEFRMIFGGLNTGSLSITDYLAANRITKVERVRQPEFLPGSSDQYALGIFCRVTFVTQSNVEFTQITQVRLEYSQCYASNGQYVRHGCVIEKAANTNPFVTGEKGNWRKWTEYAFLTDRVQGWGSETDIRSNGSYAAYSNFWTYSSTEHLYLPVTTNWQWKLTSTTYLPEGMEAENKDPLGRHNSVLYNSSRQPVASANNAEFREIGFESFENSDPYTPATCSPFHWRFALLPTGASRDASVSHSGIVSLKITGQQVSNKYPTNNCGGTNQTPDADCICKDCIRPFAPYPGRYYVISAWVRSNTLATDLTNRGAQIKVLFDQGGANSEVTCSPSGPIIEGWQRIESKFQVPSNAKTIEVVLRKVSSEGPDCWFDDLRIFPVNSTIKTYVYDPASLRLVSELDENNYASFFQYDEQGALRRINKETENGILTVKEAHSHTGKK